MIYALVTIYNPSEIVKDNLILISQKVTKIFLCDNSKSDNSSLFRDLENSRYIFNNANLGLSQAFNKVFETEKFDKNDLIIFFDQDSRIDKNHIENLEKVYEDLKKNNFSIGAIGPVFYNTSSNSIEMPHSKNLIMENVWKVKSIITSSMLINYDVLKSIGFWNEKVFLDMADWDLCWRLMKSGKSIYMTDKATLYHSVGNGDKFIGKIRLRTWNPIREYYQIRDSIYLLTRLYVPPKYKVKFLLNLLLKPILILFFYDRKKQRIKYYFLGIIDYFKGRTGEK